MVFGTLQDLPFDFNLGGHTIVTCTVIRYIDVIFSHNMHFYQTGEHYKVEQARKAIHVLF